VNLRPYDRRGWCIFESALAKLAAYSLQERWLRMPFPDFRKLVLISGTGASPCTQIQGEGLDTIRRNIQAAEFTNGRSDKSEVIKLFNGYAEQLEHREKLTTWFKVYSLLKHTRAFFWKATVLCGLLLSYFLLLELVVFVVDEHSVGVFWVWATDPTWASFNDVLASKIAGALIIVTLYICFVACFCARCFPRNTMHHDVISYSVRSPSVDALDA